MAGRMGSINVLELDDWEADGERKFGEWRGYESWTPLQYLEVRIGEGLAHEGEGFGAAEVVVAGVGRAAGPLGGFLGADDGGGGFHGLWIVDRRWWMVRRRLTIDDC